MSGMTIAFIIVILAIAGSIVFFSIKPKKKRRTDSIYTDALNAMIRNDRKTALSLLRDVVRHDSNHVDAYLQLGNILRETHPQQALKIHQSLTVRPNLSKTMKIDIHQALALDYQLLGRLPLAKRETEQILKIERRNLIATEFLLSIAVSERNWTEASTYAKVFQRITNTQDKQQLAQFQVYEGMDKLEQGDRNGARSSFKKALKIAPDFGEPNRHLGDLLEDERDLVKAIEHWEKYATLSPNGAKGVFNKIETALFDLGRFGEVENFYRRILEKDPANLEALSKLANVMEEKGDRQTGLELVDNALARNESSLHIRLMKLKLSLTLKPPHELAHQIDTLRTLIAEIEKEH